jgi:FkbM family methyltransferase
MVTSERSQPLSLGHRVTYRLVRALLQTLILSNRTVTIEAIASAFERNELSNALMQAFLRLNRTDTIETIASVLEHSELSNAHVDTLVQMLIRSHSALTTGAIAKVLERKELSNGRVDTLIRGALGSLRDKEMPQGMLDLFQEISGASPHYSQEGEDILLNRILSPDKVGFFVDIGAHHPIRFSNTYALYRKGWRGINVDATPGSMEMFKKLRPADINIECAVSTDDTPMMFHMFTESALNTFDLSLTQEYIDSGWALERTVEIKPRSLASILMEYLPTGKHIDLFSIDVEGKELEVLRSNDWHSYCPDLIVLEVLATPFASLHSHPTVSFLAHKGYEPISRLTNSVILQHRS